MYRTLGVFAVHGEMGEIEYIITYYFTICAENRQKNIFVYGQHVYVLFYVETRFRFVVMAAKYELERGRQGGVG